MTYYPCPLCGRSVNRRGVPFTDESQTVAHITGAHDGAHKGERGEDHRDEIASGATETLAEDDEQVRPMTMVELWGERMTVRDAVDVIGMAIEDESKHSYEDTGRLDDLEQRQKELVEEVATVARQTEELYQVFDMLAERGELPRFDWEERR